MTDPTRPGDPGAHDDGATGDQAFVRGLLGEAGRVPEPLPEDVGARLDEVLAGLVAERDAPAAAIPLERGRRRRRRATQLLTAAAAVVVVGYAGGQLLVQGGAGDAMSSNDAAGGASAPEAASGSGGSGGGADAYPLSSQSLPSDARRLVASDTSAYLVELHASSPPDPTAESDKSSARTSDPLAAGQDAAQDPSDDRDKDPAERGVTRAPRTDGTCVDPLVPAGLTRLSVTYDGAAATAVLRPVAGTNRVRVEVWDCATPRRVASVVVRR